MGIGRLDLLNVTLEGDVDGKSGGQIASEASELGDDLLLLRSDGLGLILDFLFRSLLGSGLARSGRGFGIDFGLYDEVSMIEVSYE
jgi:hypothetical protein